MTQTEETIHWEGRLDNAVDLAVSLGVPCLYRNPPALALAVYRKWGVAGLARLLGDWNLAIQVPAERTTILAADYAGILPLYYRKPADGGRLIWSSRLQDLAAPDGGPIRVSALDRDYLADYICFGRSTGDSTPYKDVHFVLPGHAVVFRDGKQTLHRFWNAPADCEIRYRNGSEYAQHLFDLFSGAVKARLGERGFSWIELSGGLDSSSVACMAAHIWRRGECTADVRTLTYEEPGSTDLKFVAAVEESSPFPATHLNIQRCLPADKFRAGVSGPEFWQPRFETLQGLGHTGSLLSGQLGDLVMGNWEDDSEQVGDRFRRFQFWKGLKEAVSWGKILGEPVYPILWRSLRSAMGVPVRVSGQDEVDFDDSLSPELRNGSLRREAQRLERAKPASVRPSLFKRNFALNEAIASGRLRQPGTLTGISMAHPFADRRLVEFMLSVPPEVTCRPGEPRALMREAFRGILPAMVGKRQSKSSYTQTYRQAFQPLAADVAASGIADMHLVKAGVLDGESLRKRIQMFRQGLPCNEHRLRHILLLEFWIRNVTGSQSPLLEMDNATLESDRYGLCAVGCA
jgi:asparagine synthase (glutamine-hydrolysing)